MKHLLLPFFLVLFSSPFCIAQEELSENLPDSIQRYIKTYFPNQKVVKYKSEISLESAKYKVFIDDGVCIAFDEDYQPITIDNTAGIPDIVIPKKVLDYVKKHFPTHQINQWQKRGINQTIILEDGTRIKFDDTGNFIRLTKN